MLVTGVEDVGRAAAGTALWDAVELYRTVIEDHGVADGGFDAGVLEDHILTVLHRAIVCRSNSLPLSEMVSSLR